MMPFSHTYPEDEDRSVKAVHDFVRFQIEEHQTGDPRTVGAP